MQISNRKIGALRNLAERPGTTAEGIAARLALTRLNVSKIQYETLRRYDIRWQVNEYCTCPCGTVYHCGEKCTDFGRHVNIMCDLRARFPRGTEVFYSKWCYAPNLRGRVTGFPMKPFDGDWHWIRVKFDHLKSAISIPTRSAKGGHLFTAPVTSTEAEQLCEP